MKLNEYQVAAFRTCPDLGEPFYGFGIPYPMQNNLALKLNLNHMVSGMNSELSELDDAYDHINEQEELADIMWYVGGYCTFRKYDLQRIIDYKPTTIRSLAWYIQELTDLVKKFTAYNKPIDATKESMYLGSIVLWIQSRLGEETFNKALQNNIDKLRARYPDRFTEEAAVNRNLDAERKELEK